MIEAALTVWLVPAFLFLVINVGSMLYADHAIKQEHNPPPIGLAVIVSVLWWAAPRVVMETTIVLLNTAKEAARVKRETKTILKDISENMARFAREEKKK